MIRTIYEDSTGAELKITKGKLHISYDNQIGLTFKLSEEDIRNLILELNEMLDDGAYLIDDSIFTKLKRISELTNN